MRSLFWFVAGIVTAFGVSHCLMAFVRESEQQLAGVAARALLDFVRTSRVARISVETQGLRISISLRSVATELLAFSHGKRHAVQADKPH